MKMQREEIEKIFNSYPDFLSPKQTALILGVCEKTLANRRSRGELPEFVKFNKRVRYPKDKFLEYLLSVMI